MRLLLHLVRGFTPEWHSAKKVSGQNGKEEEEEEEEEVEVEVPEGRCLPFLVPLVALCRFLILGMMGVAPWRIWWGWEWGWEWGWDRRGGDMDMYWVLGARRTRDSHHF